MLLEVGSSGQFDVLLGDEVIASKVSVGLVRRLLGDGFPDPDATLAALRARRPA